MEKPDYDIDVLKNQGPFIAGLDFAAKSVDDQDETVLIRVKTKAKSTHAGAIVVIECNEMPPSATILCHVIKACLTGMRHTLCDGYTIFSPGDGVARFTRAGDYVSQELGPDPVFGMFLNGACDTNELRASIHTSGFMLYSEAPEVNAGLEPVEWSEVAPADGPPKTANTIPTATPHPRLTQKVLTKVSEAFARFK